MSYRINNREPETVIAELRQRVAELEAMRVMDDERRWRMTLDFGCFDLAIPPLITEGDRDDILYLLQQVARQVTRWAVPSATKAEEAVEAALKGGDA